MNINGSLFLYNLQEHNHLFLEIAKLDDQISNAIHLIVDAFSSSKKLMICGNGGSAADSQHIAAEFTGRFIRDRRPLPAIALSTDTSALTCIANDYSYAEVFSRQVVALGHENDCILGISTSGNSENILRAMAEAKKIGMKTIGLIGGDGGLLAPICDCSIVVPSNVTARIQEAHILIGHTLCGAVEQKMGLVSG